MIIHSFDRAGEIHRFDPSTGAVTPVAETDTDVRVPTCGHYGLLEGTLVVLYRSGESLLLRIDGMTTPVDDAHRVSHQQEGNRRLLRVTDRRTGDPVATLTYALPEPIVSLSDDPTPFTEAEDFDFGLFVANVASDSGRRDRVYREADPAG